MILFENMVDSFNVNIPCCLFVGATSLVTSVERES